MENMNWQGLPFAYYKTDYNIRCVYQDGKWGDPVVSQDETLSIHISATALHYGQEAFEGLKAYTGTDGRIRLFRIEENSKRLNRSALGVMMPEVPQDLFIEIVEKAVRLNKKYVPPHGTGAALYVRPLLIGSGAEIGVKPAREYTFLVFVTPVGPYFKDGFKPVNLMISRNYDRAAPLGTGSYKIGGNYAASLRSLNEAHQSGFGTTLYLDAKEKKYIDEAGPANFFAIKGNSYITPDSSSILPSITNSSLQQIAQDMGMTIEKRPVSIDELGTFDEAGACGTAAVIAPVGTIYDPENNTSFEFAKNGEPGPTCKKLYQQLTNIQFGDEPDKYGWIRFID